MRNRSGALQPRRSARGGTGRSYSCTGIVSSDDFTVAEREQSVTESESDTEGHGGIDPITFSVEACKSMIPFKLVPGDALARRHSIDM